MAFTFLTNSATLTGADTAFQLKTRLKLGGWTVMSSSDGTTYNSSGDQITTNTTGAGGMNNTNAWFRIRCPAISGITRELVFQRIGAATSFRIKYSYSAGFTGGTPGATRVPSAIDEGVFLGSGTDASPTGGNWQNGTGGQVNIAVGDSAEGYSFYSTVWNSTPTCLHTMYMDLIDNLGSDPDPYVFYVQNSNITTASSWGTGTACFCWMGKGKSYETFTNVGGITPYVSSILVINDSKAPGNFGVNPYTGNDNEFYIYYGKNSTSFPGGIKGRSHLLRFCSSSRAFTNTLNTQTRLCMNDFTLPWDGVTTPT